MAAHSIMPSAPRLTIPAFSLINRPSAAMASTVPAFSVAAKSSAYNAMSGSLWRWTGRGHKANAIHHQSVASEKLEKEQALEHARQPFGQAQPRLRQFADDI